MVCFGFVYGVCLLWLWCLQLCKLQRVIGLIFVCCIYLVCVFIVLFEFVGLLFDLVGLTLFVDRWLCVLVWYLIVLVTLSFVYWCGLDCFDCVYLCCWRLRVCVFGCSGFADLSVWVWVVVGMVGLDEWILLLRWFRWCLLLVFISCLLLIVCACKFASVLIACYL